MVRPRLPDSAATVFSASKSASVISEGLMTESYCFFMSATFLAFTWLSALVVKNKTVETRNSTMKMISVVMSPAREPC
jgi:hypothetical protein